MTHGNGTRPGSGTAHVPARTLAGPAAPSGRHAVVVGGGLAGITAALALADAGVRVTLLEGRPRLGGLAFSFQRGGLTVDNGQHVYLRCCTAYRWFLDRIGARHWRRSSAAWTYPSSTSTSPRAGGSAGCGAIRCPYRCTWGAASPPTRTSRSPTGPGWAGPRSR